MIKINNVDNFEIWYKTKFSLYRIWKILFIIYEYGYLNSNKRWLYFYTNKQKLDLSNPEIAIIYSFYEVLNWLDTKIENKFLWTIYADKINFEFQWSIEMWSYGVSNRWNKENYVYFSYSDEEERNLNLPIPTVYEWIRWSRITYKEFFLLMQIYFWLYQNEELKKQLEENEKNWKYDEIKKNLDYIKFREENYDNVERYNKKISEEHKKINYTNYDDYITIEDYFIEKELSKSEVKEYLELELMRKDTTWAFGWLKIEKIFDKTWSEEKQKERIEEINKEFGEEVVVVE